MFGEINALFRKKKKKENVRYPFYLKAFIYLNKINNDLICNSKRLCMKYLWQTRSFIFNRSFFSILIVSLFL